MTTPTPHGAPELPVVVWRTDAPGGVGYSDKQQRPDSYALVKLSDARAAIQQAAGAVPEGPKFNPDDGYPPVPKPSAAAFRTMQYAHAWVPSALCHMDKMRWMAHHMEAALAASPSPLGREAAPNLAELLQSCRGSVKSDLSRNEQLLLVKRVPNLHAVIEAEANRLQALLDSIDALAGREKLSQPAASSESGELSDDVMEEAVITPDGDLELTRAEKNEILHRMVDGLHALVFGTYSIKSGDYALKSLGDGGEIHEYVHAMIRLLPLRCYDQINPGSAPREDELTHDDHPLRHWSRDCPACNSKGEAT